MTDPARQTLLDAIATALCPYCKGDNRTPPCRSCRGRGTASVRAFASKILHRSTRSIQRMVSGKDKTSGLVAAHCAALLQAQRDAMTAAATQKSGT